MLLEHWVRRAASRADCTAGSRSEIKMPMIVMTTSSSTSVKPSRADSRKGFRSAEVAIVIVPKNDPCLRALILTHSATAGNEQ